MTVSRPRFPSYLKGKQPVGGNKSHRQNMLLSACSQELISSSVWLSICFDSSPAGEVDRGRGVKDYLSALSPKNLPRNATPTF